MTMNDCTVGKCYEKEDESVEKGEPKVEVVSEKTTTIQEHHPRAYGEMFWHT